MINKAGILGLKDQKAQLDFLNIPREDNDLVIGLGGSELLFGVNR